MPNHYFIKLLRVSIFLLVPFGFASLAQAQDPITLQAVCSSLPASRL